MANQALSPSHPPLARLYHPVQGCGSSEKWSLFPIHTKVLAAPKLWAPKWCAPKWCACGLHPAERGPFLIALGSQRACSGPAGGHGCGLSNFFVSCCPSPRAYWASALSAASPSWCATAGGTGSAEPCAGALTQPHWWARHSCPTGRDGLTSFRPLQRPSHQRAEMSDKEARGEEGW